MLGLALALVVLLALAPASIARAQDDGFSPPQLIGRAVLPAATYAGGSPSGAALGTSPVNGVTPPFPGTTIRFRSSERVAVTLTVTRTVRGRKVVDGTSRRSAAAGANAIAFRGRVGARLRRAGRYAVRIDAVDAAGNRARPRTLRLTVTRRRSRG